MAAGEADPASAERDLVPAPSKVRRIALPKPHQPRGLLPSPRGASGVRSCALRKGLARGVRRRRSEAARRCAAPPVEVLPGLVFGHLESQKSTGTYGTRQRMRARAAKNLKFLSGMMKSPSSRAHLRMPRQPRPVPQTRARLLLPHPMLPQGHAGERYDTKQARATKTGVDVSRHPSGGRRAAPPSYAAEDRECERDSGQGRVPRGWPRCCRLPPAPPVPVAGNNRTRLGVLRCRL